MNDNVKKLFKYLFICHRRPDRSFFIKGKQFPLCARCTGIVLGYFAGVLMFAIGVRMGLLFILLALPLIIDGFGQLNGRWDSTNPRRFITGTLFGISVDYYIIFGLTDVFAFGKNIGKMIIK